MGAVRPVTARNYQLSGVPKAAAASENGTEESKGKETVCLLVRVHALALCFAYVYACSSMCTCSSGAKTPQKASAWTTVNRERSDTLDLSRDSETPMITGKIRGTCTCSSCVPLSYACSLHVWVKS